MDGTIDSAEEGWRQVGAGLGLIVWSQLATWNAEDLRLIATSEERFESPAGHALVQKQFGRLICWITFAVGAEYLAKGVCLVRGRLSGGRQRVIRPPCLGEDVSDWIALVKANHPAIYDEDPLFQTLANLPVGKLVKPGHERDLVNASFRLLASSIRNRDAHRYTHNVRAFHFHAVESLFVPAFNTLLRSLDGEELRVRLAGVAI